MANQNNDITPRFLRHVNLLSIANFDEETLIRIFTTILNISFEGHPEQKHSLAILKNCIELFEDCVKILKPTPSKSHYIFNLRDLSKFVMGMCRVDKAKIHSENIGRLWSHEAHRIFVDRLLPEDKHLVEGLI
jgi:dynein heavy chain